MNEKLAEFQMWAGVAVDAEELNDPYDKALWHAWQAGYLAGAGIMREECMKLVYGMCESDNVAARTVETIRKIEA